MRQSLADLFRSPARPAARVRPGLEPLERRDVPAISFNAGVITITGSSMADTATVKVDNQGTPWASDDQVVVKLSSGYPESKSYYLWKAYPAQDRNVTLVRFSGGDGVDSFTNQTDIPSQAYGGAGRDSL